MRAEKSCPAQISDSGAAIGHAKDCSNRFNISPLHYIGHDNPVSSPRSIPCLLHQYPETLPLNDYEVVLTFDDGLLPRHTNLSPFSFRAEDMGENRDFRAAMACPPHARAAYESIANAPTAPRNISPWAGARAGAAVAQDRARPGRKHRVGALTMPRSPTHKRRRYHRARPDGRDDFAKLDPAEFPDARN